MTVQALLNKIKKLVMQPDDEILVRVGQRVYPLVSHERRWVRNHDDEEVMALVLVAASKPVR